MIESFTAQLEDSGYEFPPWFYRCLKHRAESSLLDYVKFFMQRAEGTRFIESCHHQLIEETLQKVKDGEYNRVIINVPPGMSKTEFVKAFISRALGENPRCRFINGSCSADLALDNSSSIRDTVKSREFRILYPRTEVRRNKDSDKLWRTTEGGGVYSVSTGGPVIGFRAGRMEPGFQGALVIDDPDKPDDMNSKTLRDRNNRRFGQTIKTRLALSTTPIIIIMQRLHEDDLSGFLLKGGSGDKWHHLILPVSIEENGFSYPSRYTHGMPIEYNLPPGPLWAFKYSVADIGILKADKETFAAQFMQAPGALGGGVFTTSDFKYYSEYDPKNSEIVLPEGSKVQLLYKQIYADTAMKTGQDNDFSVFQCWGKGADKRIYLLDQARSKWEAPDLKTNFLRFCKKHEFRKNNSLGVRARKVEDKASGIGLIQDINKQHHGYIIGIPRDRDKVSRAKSGTIPIREGQVVLPKNAYWLDEYLEEFDLFSSMMTHKHDDQIDPTLDAISEMVTPSTIYDTYKKLTGQNRRAERQAA